MIVRAEAAGQAAAGTTVLSEAIPYDMITGVGLPSVDQTRLGRMERRTQGQRFGAGRQRQVGRHHVQPTSDLDCGQSRTDSVRA